MNWLNIYKNDIKKFGSLFTYTAFKRFKYYSYITLIKKNLPVKGTIIEAGSGTGSIISYFSGLYDSTGIDKDTDMISLAKSRNDNTKYLYHDILQPLGKSYRADVTFSNGVLEHFSDTEVIKIINNQLKYSKIVIFSIPTIKYSAEDRIYGDERFLSYEKWITLINSSNGKLTDSYAGYLFLFQYRYIKCRILSEKFVNKADFWVFILREKNAEQRPSKNNQTRR